MSNLPSPAADRNRNTAGRQVRAIQPARPSRDGSEGRGYARCVGRVGALAVALGVGSAIAAMPVAFADTTGSGGSTGSGSSAASDSASSRPESRVRTRTGLRGGSSVVAPAEGTSNGGSPARSGTGSAATTGGSSAETVRGGRRGAGVAETAGEVEIPSVRDRSTDTAPAPTGVPRTAPDSQVAPSPSVSAAVVPEPGVSAADSSPAVPTELTEPVSVAVEAVAVPVVAEAPVMAASPRPASASGSVDGMSRGLLSWLQAGGDGQAPAAAPLMWAAAAISRGGSGEEVEEEIVGGHDSPREEVSAHPVVVPFGFVQVRELPMGE